MEKMLLPLGKVIKTSVIGPIKVAKEYAKIKINMRKFEKQHPDVVPLNKLKKKMYTSDNKFVDLSNEISNPFLKVIQSTSSNTTDVYFDQYNKPVLSCSYSVKQRLVNKDTQLVCNLISVSATQNSDYYYLAVCIKYNIATTETESMLTRLLSKVR